LSTGGGLTVSTSTPVSYVTKYVVTSPIGVYGGNGSPEGVVIAEPGAIYANYLGGAGQSLWVKESGSGSAIGWEELQPLDTITTRTSNYWSGSNYFAVATLNDLYIGQLSATNFSLMSTGANDGLIHVQGLIESLTNNTAELVASNALTLNGTRYTSFATVGGSTNISDEWTYTAVLLNATVATNLVTSSLIVTGNVGSAEMSVDGNLSVSNLIWGENIVSSNNIASGWYGVISGNGAGITNVTTPM
jgi:hypothetical protein